jgi:hypothetical protein
MAAKLVVETRDGVSFWSTLLAVKYRDKDVLRIRTFTIVHYRQPGLPRYLGPTKI